MPLKPGQKSPTNAIYKCSKCGNINALIKGEVASECDVCMTNNNKQAWIDTGKEIIFITKNIKGLIERRMTLTDRLTDKITAFCGNMIFVYVHLIWFALWLIYNSVAEKPFDPFPFGILTMIVSLEAILLATLILIFQNRQVEISELRSESDYRVDLKTEKKISEVLALLREIHFSLAKKDKVKKSK